MNEWGGRDFGRRKHEWCRKRLWWCGELPIDDVEEGGVGAKPPNIRSDSNQIQIVDIIHFFSFILSPDYRGFGTRFLVFSDRELRRWGAQERRMAVLCIELPFLPPYIHTLCIRKKWGRGSWSTVCVLRFCFKKLFYDYIYWFYRYIKIGYHEELRGRFHTSTSNLILANERIVSMWPCRSVQRTKSSFRKPDYKGSAWRLVYLLLTKQGQELTNFTFQIWTAV